MGDIILFTQNAFAKEKKGISVDNVKKIRKRRPAGNGILTEKQFPEDDFEK